MNCIKLPESSQVCLLKTYEVLNAAPLNQTPPTPINTGSNLYREC